MKRIAVPRRIGHERADDREGEDCLVLLHRVGIPAHLGKAEQGYISSGLKKMKMSNMLSHFFELTASR
jgi:hypothetical protein